MKQLTPLQAETMEYLKAQIDEARAQHIDMQKVKNQILYILLSLRINRYMKTCLTCTSL